MIQRCLGAIRETSYRRCSYAVIASREEAEFGFARETQIEFGVRHWKQPNASAVRRGVDLAIVTVIAWSVNKIVPRSLPSDPRVGQAWLSSRRSRAGVDVGRFRSLQAKFGILAASWRQDGYLCIHTSGLRSNPQTSPPPPDGGELWTLSLGFGPSVGSTTCRHHGGPAICGTRVEV